MTIYKILPNMLKTNLKSIIIFIKEKTKNLLRFAHQLFINPRFNEFISTSISIISFIFPKIDRWFFNLSKKRLLEQSNKNNLSIENIISITLNYFGYWIYRDIRPWQVPSEIKRLIMEVLKISPQNVLEIGTYNGGTLFLWTKVFNARLIITIDLPTCYPPTKIKFYNLFNDNHIDIHYLRGNSQKEETVYNVSQILKSDKIDFLFIDGDHSYDGVKRDFQLYSPFVKKGGIIALHDINNPRLGVFKFWEEVKMGYSSKEVIAKKDEMQLFARSSEEKKGWGGIGIIYI